MPSPHRFARVVALLAGALVLSGCFAAAPGGGAENRLGVALSFQPVANLSPYSDDALLLTKLGTTETLTVLDADGMPRPGLAESWEQTDPRTLRLNLRPGVTFHDGTPLTAENAAASINHVTTATTPPRAIKGVQLTARAAGERTLEITTAEPDPILPQRLTAPQLAILAPSAYADPAAPNPVRAGTGPYALDSVQGTSGATLSANPGYWGGPPKTAGIDARFIADGASRANALRAGEVDVVDTVPVSQLPTVSGNEVLDVPLPRLVGAHLNTRSAVFADPATRAAARQAIDPVAIAQGVYAGQADPARGLFGPASPWAGEAPRPATAPGAARGTIRIATYDERPELPEIASVVAENLRAAGFQVSDVVAQEYSTIESDLLSGSYDVVIGARNYSVDTGDPISYLSSDWTCDGAYNLSRLCDPAIDAAVDAARSAPIEERERAAVRIAEQVIGTDAVVPIAHERTRIGVAPGVRGVAQDGFDHRLITAETALGA
ncbi:ABC transporter substrate-binding protein [Saccharopolyspora sp. TS4A08]|uniref:ABC transporter substrate-binding protein n=1 Tax=Saccharopolyspora ipomoeae TaxID=3042027 RepID=A0ABT6PLI8_9PSEU|nr:ABC transporter substrate-binding protein [Saccharopolyspora sp. TS4A08]MDI2028864.1 ABC transporter substrate-binding protein [Saccharopolyspora sp. TS4A08]